MAREPQGVDETVAAFAGPAVVFETAKPERTMSTLDEVFRAQVAGSGIVGTNLRHAGEARCGVQIDERHAQLSATLHQFGRRVAADHASSRRSRQMPAVTKRGPQSQPN